MDNGIMQNGFAMDALERHQAFIANNLACSEVRGYKQNIIAFEGKKNGFIGGSDTNTFDSLMPSIVSKSNTATGAFERTGVATDVAIEGDSYFKVVDSNGLFSFSKNGSFHINNEGYLTDSIGRRVITDGGEVQFSNNGGVININGLGQIFEGADQIGTLSAYKLPSKLQNNCQGRVFRANELNGVVVDDSVKFSSGFLEKGNVSPIQEMVNLIRVSHAHEANQSIIKQLDSQLGDAIQTLGTTNL